MSTWICDKGRSVPCAAALVSAAVLLLLAATAAMAQSGTTLPAGQAGIDPRKVFFMLFLMLGPIKILVPFVNLTKGSDALLRRRIARRSILFSAAALGLAGVLGRTMLENFDISVPVLALTGGIILFLVALQAVLQQSTGMPVSPRQEESEPGMHLALTPLAFPITVTPYGIAAVIVFATLARQDGEKLVVAGMVLLILVLDWLAMLFAEAVVRWLGTALQVFAVVLGVTQIALGLQVIVQSLAMLGLPVGQAES
jgi:multiple antibiotic resistance protein